LKIYELLNCLVADVARPPILLQAERRERLEPGVNRNSHEFRYKLVAEVARLPISLQAEGNVLGGANRNSHEFRYKILGPEVTRNSYEFRYILDWPGGRNSHEFRYILDWPGGRNSHEFRYIPDLYGNEPSSDIPSSLPWQRGRNSSLKCCNEFANRHNLVPTFFVLSFFRVFVIRFQHESSSCRFCAPSRTRFLGPLPECRS